MQRVLKNEVMSERYAGRASAKLPMRQVPGERFFLFIERLFEAIITDGGRMALVLAVTGIFYFATFLGLKQAFFPGSICLIAFLRLARAPGHAPGIFKQLLLGQKANGTREDIEA